MGVHDDHRRRVYERFLREGLAGFEEHNAMEFLLFLARPRGDTNPLAHALIDRFGLFGMPVTRIRKRQLPGYALVLLGVLLVVLN